MAYMRLFFNTAQTDTNSRQRMDSGTSYGGAWLKALQEFFAGNLTSATQGSGTANLSTYSNVNNSLVPSNSIIINDAAHRQNKYATYMATTSTSTSSSYNEYMYRSVQFSGSSSDGTFTFTKRHYASKNFAAAQTAGINTSFDPFIYFKLRWNTSYGLMFQVKNRSGSNPRPGNDNYAFGGSSSSYVMQTYLCGDPGMHYMDVWMGDTFFAFSVHKYYTGAPSSNSSGQNSFFYWGDFPVIKDVDQHAYSTLVGSTYYPGVLIARSTRGDDIRVKGVNNAGTTSTNYWGAVTRPAAFTGTGKSFVPAQFANVGTQYGFGTYDPSSSYNHYGYIYPPFSKQITPLPNSQGTGTPFIPVQYIGPGYSGRGTSGSANTTIGENWSRQSHGDARHAPCIGLYRLADDLGDNPGQRIRIGSDFYRTAFTGRGAHSNLHHQSAQGINVVGMPEKSIPGPDVA